MSAQLIVMTGNLAADPELSFTATGTARARLSVAVQDRYRDKSGAFVDGETYFARCVAWGDLAERVTASARRGDRVIVTGAMVGRSWDKEDGTKGYAQEIRLEDVGVSLRWAEASVKRVSGSRAGDTVPGVMVTGSTAWDETDPATGVVPVGKTKLAEVPAPF